VLMGSAINESLFSTLLHIFVEGWCALVTRLANDLPRRSTFFISYVLSDLLIMLPGYDLLQGGVLACLPISLLLRLKCAAKCGPLFGLEVHKILQRRWHAYMYTRAQLIINVGMLFCCIAPLVIPFVALWLAFALPIYAHNFKHCLVTPQGGHWDAGGVYWPVAVKTQVLSLIMSQLVLGTIMAINSVWWGAGFLLLLMYVTWVRAESFASHFEPLAKALSMQQCSELDAEQWGRGGEAACGMPADLELVLREGRREYEQYACCLPDEEGASGGVAVAEPTTKSAVVVEPSTPKTIVPMPSISSDGEPSELTPAENAAFALRQMGVPSAS